MRNLLQKDLEACQKTAIFELLLKEKRVGANLNDLLHRYIGTLLLQQRCSVQISLSLARLGRFCTVRTVFHRLTFGKKSLMSFLI